MNKWCIWEFLQGGKTPGTLVLAGFLPGCDITQLWSLFGAGERLRATLWEAPDPAGRMQIPLFRQSDRYCVSKRRSDGCGSNWWLLDCENCRNRSESIFLGVAWCARSCDAGRFCWEFRDVRCFRVLRRDLGVCRVRVAKTVFCMFFKNNFRTRM